MTTSITSAAPRNTEEQLVGRSEGWGSLLNARDAHYFRDGRSLCRRWACFGTPMWESNQALGSRPRRNSGTCVTCWKKREKEETTNAQVEFQEGSEAE